MAYIFIPAGWGKITSGKWLFGDGSPIQGLVGGAISADGTPGWYVWFLENVVEPNSSLFATLVALGEFAAGLGLLVGLLTGIAAFGAVFLNANFILAGSLGSNPALVVMGLFLVVAWRNAGWIGLDRWFIPWTHRTMFEPKPAASRGRGSAPRRGRPWPPTARRLSNRRLEARQDHCSKPRMKARSRIGSTSAGADGHRSKAR